MKTKKNRNKKKGTGIAIAVTAVCLAVGLGAFWLIKIRGQEGDSVAYVQTVAEITGLGDAGLVSRYSGVVQAKDTVSINPESDMKVKECFVSAGDTVDVGTPLFCYDTAELTLSYEQLLIDIMGLENTIESDTKQIERLDKKLAKAKESAIYELELKRSEVSLEMKKAEFELEEKREKAETTKNAIDNAQVVSPCAGRVKSVKTETGSSESYWSTDSSSEDAYITIISGSALWIKCSVSEQTVHSLSVGESMRVCSRTDETDVRLGVVASIDTDTPESSSSSYYYDSSAEKATKYPFYVTVDDTEGYILGQHVIVEPDLGTAEKEGIWLPAGYVFQQDGGKSYVYAQNTAGRIELREVTLGERDEATDTVQILSGLQLTDCIAYPDGTVSAGDKAEQLTYSGEAYEEDDAGDYTDDYYAGEYFGEEDESYDDGEGYGSNEDGTVEVN